MSRKQVLTSKTTAGPSLVIGNIKMTLQSKLVRAERPAFQIVWHRPTGVLIEQDYQTKVFPIRDVTRLLQAGLLTLSLIFQLVGMIKQRRTSHEARN